jgi:hypothetical protein
VFEDHLKKGKDDDFEGDLALNYDPEIVLLTCTGIFRGHDGLRRSHDGLMKSPARRLDLVFQ